MDKVCPLDIRIAAGYRIYIIGKVYSHQQFQVIDVEKPGDGRIVFGLQRGELIIGFDAVVPLIVYTAVIMRQKESAHRDRSQRLLLQREQGQFLHHPGHRLRAMLSARLSYFDTTICVYSSALMR